MRACGGATHREDSARCRWRAGKAYSSSEPGQPHRKPNSCESADSSHTHRQLSVNIKSNTNKQIESTYVILDADKSYSHTMQISRKIPYYNKSSALLGRVARTLTFKSRYMKFRSKSRTSSSSALLTLSCNKNTNYSPATEHYSHTPPTRLLVTPPPPRLGH